jgi:plasmid stabilization system protein ParE
MDDFILTELASLDLDDIWDYIADSNIDAADRVIEKLFITMGTLAKQPDMGTIRLELADERLNPCRLFVLFMVLEI